MALICPKCNAAYNDGDVECSNCGVIFAKIKIQKASPPQQPLPKSEEKTAVKQRQHEQETTVEQNIEVEKESEIESSATKQRTTIAITLIIGLAIGYFAGREHIKYQARSAASDIALEFKNSMRNIFNGTPAASTPQKKQQIKPPKRTFPITAALIYKGSEDLEYGQKQVTFTINFSNKSEKDVRAFDGILHFTDLLDNKIKSLHVAINDPLQANSVMEWHGVMDYNQFMDEDQALLNADQQNTKLHLNLRKILYVDGEIKEFL